ncbi:MAG: hypothetical protein ACOC56_02800, partial [Atribacterota bacterium]
MVEKKAKAYVDLLNALYGTKNFIDKNCKSEIDGKEIPEKKAEKLRKKFEDANIKIKRVTYVGKIYLSKAIIKRLKQYKNEIESAGSDKRWTIY